VIGEPKNAMSLHSIVVLLVKKISIVTCKMTITISQQQQQTGSSATDTFHGDSLICLTLGNLLDTLVLVVRCIFWTRNEL
jgi:hypothetical protein